MNVKSILGVDDNAVELIQAKMAKAFGEGRKENLLAEGYGKSLLAKDVMEQGLAEYESFTESQYSLLRRDDREAVDTDAAWEMFLHAMRQQITGGAGWEGVQLLAAPTSAEWNNPKNGNYITWRVLADSIPTWQPSYLPTAKQVTTGYQAFLTNLAIPSVNPADAARVEAARTDYTDAITMLEDMYIDMVIGWKSFSDFQVSLPPNRRVSFDQWYSRTYGRRIASAEDRIRLRYQEYASWMRRASGGYEVLADALEAFNNDAYKLETKIDPTDDSAKIKLRTYSITPDLNTFIAESRSIPQTAPPRMSFSLSRSSYRYRSTETRWGGSVRYMGFFGGGASGSRSTVDVSSESFSLTFAARNMRVFTIVPGPWFTGTVIQAFRDGPWVPNGPVATGRTALWGPNGVLNLLPTQIVVVYQPRISVRLSESEYSRVDTSFRASGGFSIGPFGFGAAYSRSSTDITMDASTQTVTAADTSESPQIAAFLSTALPNFT